MVPATRTEPTALLGLYALYQEPDPRLATHNRCVLFETRGDRRRRLITACKRYATPTSMVARADWATLKPSAHRYTGKPWKANAEGTQVPPRSAHLPEHSEEEKRNLGSVEFYRALPGCA